MESQRTGPLICHMAKSYLAR